MSHKRMIGIDADTADQLVLSILKDTYDGLQSEIDELSTRRRLRAHEEQDLKDALYMLRSLQHVIRYFSVPSEYDAWLDSVTYSGDE